MRIGRTGGKKKKERKKSSLKCIVLDILYSILFVIYICFHNKRAWNKEQQQKEKNHMLKNWLTSSIVSWFGEYVEGINQENLRIAAWAGSIEFESLEIKKKVLFPCKNLRPPPFVFLNIKSNFFYSDQAQCDSISHSNRPFLSFFLPQLNRGIFKECPYLFLGIR